METLRSYRVGGIALFDIATSYLGAYALHPLLAGPGKLFRSNAQLFWAVVPAGAFIHMITGQHTFLNRKVIDEPEFNMYKAVFLALTFMMLIS